MRRSREPRSSPSTVLHGEKDMPVKFADVVDAAHIGMRTPAAPRATSFRKRASAFGLLSGAFGQEFQGLPAVPRVRSSAADIPRPIPPLPSRETIRYRAAAAVPGTKRISAWEEEDEVPKRDEPLPGVFAEDRGVAERMRRPCAWRRCRSRHFVRKWNRSGCFSAISLAQDGHLVMADRPPHDRTHA